MTEVLTFRLAFYFTLQVNTLTNGQCPNVCWYQADTVVALNVQFVFLASFLAFNNIVASADYLESTACNMQLHI